MSEFPHADITADDGAERPAAAHPAAPDPTTPDPATPDPATPDPAADTAGGDAPGPDRRPRPVVERVGMAAIALVMAVLFALVGAAAFIGGEPFLGVMGVCGCLMVLWVGGISAFRG